MVPQAKSPSLSQAELPSWALEHLLYEFGMLRETAQKLGNRHHSDDGIVENALLESFTVHARTLLDFFYGERRKPDDALAADFFDGNIWERSRPKLSGRLGEVNRRVGKEIAHLTYYRANVPRDAKGWQIIPMYLELASVVSLFVRLVPEQAVGREFLEVAIPLMPTDKPVRELTGISHLGSTHPLAIATQVLRPADLGD